MSIAATISNTTGTGTRTPLTDKVHPRQFYLGLPAVAMARIAKCLDGVRRIGIVPVDIRDGKDRPRSCIGRHARYHLPIVGFAGDGEGNFGKYWIGVVEDYLDLARGRHGEGFGGCVEGGDGDCRCSVVDEQCM